MSGTGSNALELAGVDADESREWPAVEIACAVSKGTVEAAERIVVSFYVVFLARCCYLLSLPLHGRRSAGVRMSRTQQSAIGYFDDVRALVPRVKPYWKQKRRDRKAVEEETLYAVTFRTSHNAKLR